ncbi:DEAD/DEAH box helicase [Desulfatitalea alkaliphila]|uniref:DEAD/DEAH box helicase n=1 Tax=Desulfatitalea alkaliphila TaxID=2929485 RepID=A0AA41R526_9BACT|nr:DEAD/DEAH box helicase [Desulfatitalea alkaliphila]
MNLRLSNHLTLTRVPLPIRTALEAELQFANPKWLENERMGRWNRGVPKTLKFFHRSGKDGLIVPRGLTRKVILACRHHQEPVVMDDRRRKGPSVDFRFQGELRPYQQAAVDAMLKKDFGTLSAPTGSGKTVMALHMIAQRRQPAIVVVHTRELALQWIARIEAFLGIPEKEIGWIGGGRRRLGAAVTVAMVQSLYKCADEIAAHFGHLVVDECHRAPSRTFTEAVTAFDTRYMLGLSATPFRRDGLSKLIFWHLGDVHHRLAAADLVAGGQILDIEVMWRTTDFVAYADPVSEYSRMLSELTHNDTRNRLIVADLAEEVNNAHRPGVCLVLSDRKLHCQVLQALLKHKHHVDAELLTGDLSAEQRKAVIERVNSGAARVLIATGQLIGEGFDCPRLSTLFLATPVRFSGRMMQYLGRILRPTPGIERARVYDYVDVLVPPLNKAAQARRGVYEGLEQVWGGG